MTLHEILLSGGAGVLVLLTLIQIVPIKINPWSALCKAIGRALNADILQDLQYIKAEQKRTQAMLDEHIAQDDERAADMHRMRILQFNNELLRSIPHTREDFIEILLEIDKYEEYCRTHTGYKNNRASHAVSNICRVYDERLQKHDFL